MDDRRNPIPRDVLTCDLITSAFISGVVRSPKPVAISARAIAKHDRPREDVEKGARAFSFGAVAQRVDKPAQPGSSRAADRLPGGDRCDRAYRPHPRCHPAE